MSITFSTAQYAPRPTACRGIIEHGRWRLKRYAITLPDAAHDADAFNTGLPLALAELPQPPEAVTRAGVEFVICNSGHDADGVPIQFLSIFWWDNRNELFTRLWVSGPGTEDRWVRGGQGIGLGCVWDLLVIEHERAVYVRTMLSASPDAEDIADALTVAG